MMAYTVLEKIKIKLAPLWHKKRSYIAVYKGMVVYKGPGDHCMALPKQTWKFNERVILSLPTNVSRLKWRR